MIEILKNEKDFIKLHQEKQNKSFGFVPTMGNLHAGHISLLETSLKENDISIVSIYVNPTQFSPEEDLSSYPRTFEEDLAKIQKLKENYSNKDIYVFFPENNTVIYPEGFSDYVSVRELNAVIEGEVRPSHFDGVATVVKRLFNIVKPHRAYFGKKDYQQLRLVEKLVEQEKLSVHIIGLPIIREENGLALSSRNNYLSLEQKELALTLSQKLQQLAQELASSGLEATKKLALKSLQNDPRFNYLEIRRQKDLKLPSEDDKSLVLLGNFQLGSTRLLDNLEVTL